MKMLRPYQIEDVETIIKKKLPAAGIFNEQRTGKTPTSLVAMDKVCKGKIVIISPASMVLRWAEEAKEWTQRPVYCYLGTTKERGKILEDYISSKNGVLIISYNLFRTTKISQGLKLIIKRTKPEGLIVDEAHRAVNRDTANFKSLRSIVGIPYRLYLTGTPAPNHPAQVWSLLTMIEPDMFPSYWNFVEMFFKLERQYLSGTTSTLVGRSYITKPGEFLSDYTKDQYLEILNKYCIMRKRKDVMKWLPKEEPPIRIKLPLTKQQRKYLDELSNYYETEHVVVQGILDQILRYRQICLAPELLDLPSKSPKLEWIKEYISDYRDKSIIIFSKFAKFINLLKKYKIVEGEIVGSTPLITRQQLINDFQSGKIKTLAIQIDAGKEGLTLDQADTLIFSDVFPPVSDILQAKDRIVATTPERNKPKEIIELCHKDSYDEIIYDLVEKRMNLTDLANNYINYIKERRNK